LFNPITSLDYFKASDESLNQSSSVDNGLTISSEINSIGIDVLVPLAVSSADINLC
jgi:hypothetical protein